MSRADGPALRVPLFDVALTAEDRAAVLATLDSGWLTMGPRTERFERAFAEVTGAAHVVAVSNGTAALHLALCALGIGSGDEVICPSLTFVATANAVRYVGATPVFCDIVGPHDLNLDPADVARRITPRTRAVMVVHYAGYPADMHGLTALAEEHGLALVEDAAHACVSRLGGRSCGTFGAAGCFSFYSNKNMTCGEGGAVITDDPRLYDALRSLRSHGLTSATVERHRGRAHSYDAVGLGYNYRLDELRSSLLSSQLGQLEERLEQRARHVEGYRARLRDTPVVVPDFGARAPGDRVAHHILPTLLPAGVDRAAVMRHMRAAGVQTSIHYPPVHHLSAYRDLGPAAALPHTEAVAARELTLPLFPTMTDAQLELVCDAVTAALAAPAEGR